MQFNETRPENWKFHQILNDLNIAFSAVFVYQPRTTAEEQAAQKSEIRAIMHDWIALMDNEKTVYRNNPTPQSPNDILKLYMPRIPLERPVGVTGGMDHRTYYERKFDMPLNGESWVELTLAKPNKSRATLACFRKKRTITVNAAEVEIDGYPFGFGIPDPKRQDKKFDPNTFILREYRPNSNPVWPGFEPVFISVKNGEQTQYYKLRLEWKTEVNNSKVRVSVILEKDPADRPEEFV
jgi:hypothetical protein